MFKVEGRRVKFAPGGGKSQTVNICTPAGRHGDYEWVVRLPGAPLTEAELVERKFRSVESLIGFLREIPGAEFEGPPVPRSAGAGEPPALGRSETLVDRVVAWAKNNIVISILILTGTVIIGIASVIGALDSVWSFLEKRLLSR